MTKNYKVTALPLDLAIDKDGIYKLFQSPGTYVEYIWDKVNSMWVTQDIGIPETEIVRSSGDVNIDHLNNKTVLFTPGAAIHYCYIDTTITSFMNRRITVINKDPDFMVEVVDAISADVIGTIASGEHLNIIYDSAVNEWITF